MPSYSPMKPNANSAAARARLPRSDRAATPPSAAERALRPVGYLLVALVWTVLGAIVLLLPAALPFALWSTNPDFSTEEFLTGGDVVPTVLFLVFAAVVLVPLLGYAYVALPLAAVPLAVLAWTYVGRSLLPRYAGERLSSTGWSRNVIGPPTLGPTALSLLPVHLTPWTRFWTELMLLGWRPGRRILYAGIPYGLASFLAPGWLFWPLGVVGVAVWAIVTGALVALSVALVVRAYRARVSGRRPAPRAVPGS
ncbi:hypothetical protein [Leifsonia shinshuensis]|uniref:hypothetical protein n=1 Tax=Leifsonia shinshuensis TaxID=150026 RepID=UPI00285D211A|nr:hypothetical protein [Leifsonia shinshuensis]MDR6971494.1 small-conductance mechanosensitive channel [Leifsonia shinshuensis]